MRLSLKQRVYCNDFNNYMCKYEQERYTIYIKAYRNPFTKPMTAWALGHNRKQ